MLLVCASSTDLDLTTTGRVKDALGITSACEDGYLSDLIRRASQWAERVVGYSLTAQVYQETLAGYGSAELLLSRTPVRFVLRLFDATDTGSATEVLSSQYRVEDAEAGFLARDAGFIWTAPTPVWLDTYRTPGQETRPWLAEYGAGFVYGGLSTGSANWSTAGGTTDTGRTLPDDIEEAVIQRVITIYEAGSGVLSRRVGDLAVTYAAGDEPRPELGLLAPWRRIA